MHLLNKKPALSLLMVITFLTSCKQSSTPPPSLSAEQLPAAFEKAFAKAQPETKDLASQVISAVQAQDYAKANAAIQNLVTRPGLTKEQTTIASSGLMTVNSLLQSAQAKGDTKAAEVLQLQRRNK
jgi:hypothetical protein